MHVYEGPVLLGIGSAPLAVPPDRCVHVSEIRVLSRIRGFDVFPGFWVFSFVPGSWVTSGLIPVLVPVLVVSLADLLKVPKQNLLSPRRCCSVFSEFFDLLRIASFDGPDVRFCPDPESSGFVEILPSDLLEVSTIRGLRLSRVPPSRGSCLVPSLGSAASESIAVLAV